MYKLRDDRGLKIMEQTPKKKVDKENERIKKYNTQTMECRRKEIALLPPRIFEFVLIFILFQPKYNLMPIF